MISKLPKWIEVGAFVLALIAGFVNAIGLLSFEHQSVSHVSGTATFLGTSLANGSLQQVFHLLGILLSFLIGSALAGFLLHGATLKLGKHYDTALFIEAILLLGALTSLLNESFLGHFLASTACGLQNALATKYSGAVVRTTHVTGIFTDLGIMIGAVLRGEPLDTRKAKLFSLIILGFVIGGTVGTISYAEYHFYALLFPVTVCLICAVVYRVYCRNHG